jgi:hypothetical protein
MTQANDGEFTVERYAPGVPGRAGRLRVVRAAAAVVLVPATAAFAGARSLLGHDYWTTWEQWFLGSVPGLSSARFMVEAHGGRIRTKDRPEGGATFRFLMPAEPAA